MSKQQTTRTQDPIASSLRAGLDGLSVMERRKELLRRVSVIRSGAVNTGAVSGKSSQHDYAWVCNDRQMIDLYKGYGYEEVNNTTDPDVETAFKKESGAHMRGDAILMRCHKEITEALNADRELRALERVDGAREEFESWGADRGVPVERRPQHGQN